MNLSLVAVVSLVYLLFVAVMVSMVAFTFILYFITAYLLDGKICNKNKDKKGKF